MALLFNLARMSTATTGTGTITLGSAVAGFLSFVAAGVVDGDVITYAIQDGSSSEIGRGTYTASGTTLTRTVLKSTNSNLPISLSGAAQVFITPAAEDFAIIPAAADGRLTLTSGVPVLASTVSSATTIYYTPYVGTYISVFDGSIVKKRDFVSQLSIALGSNWAADTNFDVFYGNDAGTWRLCTVAWTNSTTRATALDLTTKGFYTNGASATARYSNAATFTLPQYQGTYLGTFRTTGSTGTTEFVLGAAGAGGTAGSILIWNMYHRREFAAFVADSGSNHTYTTATIRGFNNSATYRVSMVRGLNEDGVNASFCVCMLLANVAGSAIVTLGLDSTTAKATQAVNAQIYGNGSATFNSNVTATFSGVPGLGFHYIQGLELGDGTYANTFYGGSFNGLNVAGLY